MDCIANKNGIYYDDNGFHPELEKMVYGSGYIVRNIDELCRQYGLSALSLYLTPEAMELNSIIVRQKCSGYGTAFLTDLCRWADKEGRCLALTPSGSFGSSKRRLTGFYRRFGFRKNTDLRIAQAMIRYPKQIRSN